MLAKPSSPLLDGGAFDHCRINHDSQRRAVAVRTKEATHWFVALVLHHPRYERQPCIRSDTTGGAGTHST